MASAGCVYFVALLRRMGRSYGRFHRKTWRADVDVGEKIPVCPVLQAKTGRTLRIVTLLALAVFLACAVAGMMLAARAAGAAEFWHVWGWFGYTAA